MEDVASFDRHGQEWNDAVDDLTGADIGCIFDTARSQLLAQGFSLQTKDVAGMTDDFRARLKCQGGAGRAVQTSGISLAQTMLVELSGKKERAA